VRALLTVGYQDRSISEFVDLLRGREVDVLVDVRLNPISRKKGFSKRVLAAALEEAGIGYVHRRELGNPKEIRDKAKSTEECLRLYEDWMRERWSTAVAALADELRGKRVCLVCMERHEADCHRSIVAREVMARLDLSCVEHL
jgi:uncharacterized protein (DUF488 family)